MLKYIINSERINNEGKGAAILIIKPSSELRKNYNSVAQVAINTGEPIILTLNGEGHTVLQSIESFYKREDDLHIAENLIAAERGRAAAALSGCADFGVSAAAFESYMNAAIKKGAAANG